MGAEPMQKRAAASTFHHSPWIGTTPELAAFTLHLYVAPNHSKRYAVLQGEDHQLKSV